MNASVNSSRDQPAGLVTQASVGVLATATMDAAMVLTSLVAPGAFAADELGLDMIGRWAAGLACLRRDRSDITSHAQVRGELAIGAATHYLMGIALTAGYSELLRRFGAKPGLAKATAFGLATATLPLSLMFPSMGYGFCARRRAERANMLRLMLLGHAAFGAGIGLWARLLTGQFAPTHQT
jgi:hypothetical protein